MPRTSSRARPPSAPIHDIGPRYCGSLPAELAPPYHLNASFAGRDFFDAWTFGEFDYTGGSSEYLSRSAAFENNVVEAHDT